MIYAESAAMLLATRLGKSAAHELIERASLQATKENKHLREVLNENPKVRAHFANSDIAKLFDPLAYTGMADEFITRTLKAIP